MDDFTIDQFKRALPGNLKKSVNVDLVNQIKSTLGDPEMYETYRDNMLSYTKVMQEGRFKVSSYIDAVKYISHKLMGDTNIAAYIKTFPAKYQRFITQGVASKDVASYVTAYNKSKLVNLIYEQTLIPSYILNADMYQKALNVQCELMTSANSEKVRSDAANSILTHLKMPETQKVDLNIGLQENSAIEALKASTLELVAQQRQMLSAGAMNAEEVAHSRLIIEGESEEVNK